MAPMVPLPLCTLSRRMLTGGVGVGCRVDGLSHFKRLCKLVSPWCQLRSASLASAAPTLTAPVVPPGRRPPPAGWTPVLHSHDVKTIAAQAQQFGTDATFWSEHTRTIAILHGLFGSGRNWRSVGSALGKALAERDTQHSWRVVLVDQRCHGASTQAYDAPAPHTLDASAEDVADFFEKSGIEPDILLGHSLGGKVALAYLDGDKRVMPKCTFVLDSAPFSKHDCPDLGDLHGTFSTLNVLRELPDVVPSRKWLHDTLAPRGMSVDLINWLGTNLVAPEGQGSPEPMVWQWNFAGCESLFQSYVDTCHWETLTRSANSSDASAELVIAQRTFDDWPANQKARLSSLPSHAHHVLPKSGHWLHVDNPKGLVELLMARICDKMSIPAIPPS
ncbi:hypothetical protein PPROV_000461200 [Pycnococcus provasolii]|uniref:AB hydrolase-1 domain-containing protein n=1 Tax=Pycnococcus provasolii TaxID=41880 RepID=A0A830HG28_9CHLO|nr:hypothetical protein PPROV_000461200 [Pycnococcus provasolii]